MLQVLLPMNIVYHDFIIRDNGLDVSEDSNGSIMKILLSPEMQIKFQNTSIERNSVGNGPVIDFVLSDETLFTADSACKDSPNIAFTSCSIQNNTGGRTSSIFYIDDAPWLWLRFEQ